MRSRKAVSEILASVILIIIAGTLGAVLYSTSLHTTTEQTLLLESDISRDIDSSQERFRAVGIFFDGSNIVIYVLNFGKNDLTISDIYVNNTRIANFVGQGVTIPSNEVFDAPDGPISFNYLTVINRVYEITLVSGRGVVSQYVWKRS